MKWLLFLLILSVGCASIETEQSDASIRATNYMQNSDIYIQNNGRELQIEQEFAGLCDECYGFTFSFVIGPENDPQTVKLPISLIGDKISTSLASTRQGDINDFNSCKRAGYPVEDGFCYAKGEAFERS